MSKKSKLHNRLENLFDELEADAQVQAHPEPEMSSGWTWECDTEGTITRCSTEVEQLLGISADEIVGSQLAEFALNAQSQARVQEALTKRDFQGSLEVIYLAADGKQLHSRLTFLIPGQPDKKNGRNGRPERLKGFTQVLPDQAHAAQTRSAPDLPSQETLTGREFWEPYAPTKAQAQTKPLPAPEPPHEQEIPRPPEPTPPPAEDPETQLPEMDTTADAVEPADQLAWPQADQLSSPDLDSLDESLTIQHTTPYSEKQIATPPVSQTDSDAAFDQSANVLMAPIRIQNHTLGVLELIDEDNERSWSAEENRLINDVIDQLSLALENAELFQQTQDALSETERLYQISADFNTSGTLEEILRAICIPDDHGSTPFAAALWQYESDQSGHPQWMTFTNLWTLPGRVIRTAIGTRLPLATASGNPLPFSNPYDPVYLVDMGQEQMDTAARELIFENGGQAGIFMPLSLRGRWIGQINVLWDTPIEFNERDRQRYRSLAAQAAVAVNNRLLFEQIEQRAEQLEWLSLIKDTLSQSVDEAGILSAVHMALDQSTPPVGINLLYFDTDTRGEIVRSYSAAYWQEGMLLAEAPELDTAEHLRMLNSLALFSSLPEQAFAIADIHADPRSTELLQQAAAQAHYQSLAVLPLFSAGRWQGAIQCVWRGTHELSPNEAFFLKELLEPAAAFVASHRSYLAEQDARQAMERRNLQLQTAAQVSRAASSILDPEILVKDTVDIVQNRFDLYYVGLFLVDEAAEWTDEPGSWAVLRAGTGEAGELMLQEQHRLKISGASMIGTCIATKKAQIWRGDEQEIIRYRNPFLPETHSEMALPLISRGEVIGAMTFQSIRPGDFSEADISVLQTMADQVANAIQNARLYARTESALAETSTLYAIASAASRSLEISRMLEEVLNQTLETTKFDAGVVSVYNTDKNRLDLLVSKNIPAEMKTKLVTQGLEGTLCALVFERQGHVAVQDMTISAPIDVQGVIAVGYRSYLGVPLTSKGKTLGTLCLFGVSPRSSIEADRILMEAIAQQAGIAVENANLFVQTQKALSEAEILYKASAELNTAQSYDDILDILTRYTVCGKNAQNFSINLFDKPWIQSQEPEWIHVLARRSSLPDSTTSSRYPIAAFPSIRDVLRPEAPSILEDIENESGLDENSRKLYLDRFGARSTIFAPITVSGQWIGFFNVIYQQPTTFESGEIRRLNALTSQAAVVIQGLQSIEITRQQAHEATLLFESSQELVQAGSENRIFEAALEACVRYEAIDFLAVYRFKEIAGEAYMEQVVHMAVQDAQAVDDHTFYPTNLYPYTQRCKASETVISNSIQTEEQFSVSEKQLLEQLQIRSMAAFPIHLQNQAIGILLAGYRSPHIFSQREIRFLETVNVQLGIALDNYYLLQETQRRARQLQTAAEVSRATNSILDIDELLQQVVDLVQDRFKLYYAGLFLTDQSGEWTNEPGKWAVLRAGTGIAGMQMKAQGHKLAIGPNSMIGRCVANGEAAISQNVALEPGHYKNPLLPKTTSEMALPLVALGETIGAMTIQSEEESAFSQDDIATLQTMADQVAIAIQNARLFGQTQAALSETERLYRASAELNTAHSYREILAVLVNHAESINGYQMLHLYFYDTPWTETVRPARLMHSSSLPELDQETATLSGSPDEFPIDVELMRRNNPIVISPQASPPDSPESIRLQAYLTAKNSTSALLMPLVVGGQGIGAVEVLFDKTVSVLEPDLKQLAAIGAQAAVAFQNLHSIETAEQRALEAQIRSQELALLNRVVANVSAHTDLKGALDEIAAELGTTLNVQVGIALMNENRSNLVILAEHFIQPESHSAIGINIPIVNNPSTQKVLETHKPLIIEDPLTNPMTAPLHEALTARGVQTLNIFPMMAGNEVIGTVGLDILEPGRTFTVDEIRLSESIVLQAATAIQNVRLFEQTQEALRESEALYQANTELNTVQTYDDVRSILRRYTILGEGASSIQISLFDRPWTETNLPEAIFTISQWHARAEENTAPSSHSLGTWPTGQHLLQPNFPTFVTEPVNDPRMDDTVRKLFTTDPAAAGLLFAPLNAAGRWIGHIAASYQNSMDFSEAELRRLTTLIGQASVVIQNIRNAELTRQRAAQLEKLAVVQSALSQAGNEPEIISALILATNPHTPPDFLQLWYTHSSEDDGHQIIELAAMWEHGGRKELPNLTRISTEQDALADFWISNADETIFLASVLEDDRLDDDARQQALSSKYNSLAVIPLRSGGIWQGLAVYAWMNPYDFSTDDRFLLRRILEPAAEVVARRRAYIAQRQARQESERRAIQLQTAAEIARDTTGTLALNELLARAATLVSRRYGHYHAAIYLSDEPGKLVLISAAAGAASQDLLDQQQAFPANDQSIVGYAVLTGETLLVNHLQAKDRFPLHPLLPNTGSELAIPMKIGDQVIGVLDVQSEAAEAFSPEEANVLQVLADQLAVAVDNARSYEVANLAFQQARTRAQEMTLLFNASQSLSSAPLESDEIAAIISEQFAKMLEVPECSLSLLQSDNGNTTLQTLGSYSLNTQAGKSPRVQTRNLRDHPASHQAIQTLQPIVAQANDDLLDKDLQIYLRRSGIQTLLTIPLAVKGEALGTIELVSHQWARQFSPEQLNLAMTLAAAAAVALENARLYEVQLQTAERLVEVDKLKTQFLANMSHELRTPLNSIIGFSRVILKGIDGPVTDLQEQDLNAIYNSGQHLLSLINDILDLSKIEAGKMELAIEEVDLSDMINSVMSTAVGLTKEKPIELQRDVDSDLPLAHIDRTRIRQVLINLISNAAKFTEEGFIRVSAHKDVNTDGSSIIKLTVADSGPGIAPEDQQKLFKPFSQVDASPTRKSGGTGLGLSISRHLVELHGGTLEVQSQLGQGSTFSVSLPLPELPAADIDLPFGEGPIILAVDDNRQVISLYERYLGSHNYRVIPLTNPGQAVQLASQLQPFAITLDIMMPSCDGWTILEKLKQNPETRHIPVIICSILEDQEKGFSLGAADYLVKPILEEDLVHAIHRLDSDESIQRVLVVDDDEDDLRLVKKVLDQEGRYTVETALGGQQALSLLEHETPHAIILDLYMPGLDGFSLLETLRANPHTRDIPVIIFTGGDLDEHQRSLLAAAGQAMLQKSLFTETELLQTLERSLRRFAQTENIRLNLPLGPTESSSETITE